MSFGAREVEAYSETVDVAIGTFVRHIVGHDVVTVMASSKRLEIPWTHEPNHDYDSLVVN